MKVILIEQKHKPIADLLGLLESQGHVIAGRFTLAVAERYLDQSSELPDVILAFAGPQFQDLLAFAESNWNRRVAHNYAIRPQMISVALNHETIRHNRAFQFAGSSLIPPNPQSLLCELERINSLLAELSIGKPHFIQIHDGNEDTLYCRPGERCVSLQLAGVEPGLGEVRASDRLRTFISAVMTLNGRLYSRLEFQRRLRVHPLYVRSPFTVPSLGTIKTYLDQDCIEALQASFNRAKLGFDARKILEREARAGNEVGYRMRAKWEIRHVQQLLGQTG